MLKVYSPKLITIKDKKKCFIIKCVTLYLSINNPAFYEVYVSIAVSDCCRVCNVLRYYQTTYLFAGKH